MYSFLFGPLYQMQSISPWAPDVAVFAATTLGYIAIISALVFLLIHHDRSFLKLSPLMRLRRKASEVVLVFGSVFFSWSLVVLMKWAIAAPRPFLYFSDVNPLFVYGGYDSFPSGHAAFFASLATALALYHPRMGALFYLMALAIGTGRVVSGVHFPVDILGGFALGVLVTYATYHALLASHLAKDVGHLSLPKKR